MREAVAAGRLQPHGWYFNLDHGELLGYDPATGGFALFVKRMAEQPASRHATMP